MANAPTVADDLTRGFFIGSLWVDNELGLLYQASDVSIGAAVWELFSTFSQVSKQSMPGGRLTLTSGNPVPSADAVGATNIYFTPFLTNTIALWTGSAWLSIAFAEYTLALGTLTSDKNYDIFAYLNGVALALEVLVWTNDTTRATAVTMQDGRYCKSGDKTRLYLGSFRTTSTTTTEDSFGDGASAGGKRFLWNYYHRVDRPLAVKDTTSSWSYSTAAWRQARATSGNKVEFIIGIAEDTVFVSAFGLVDTTGPKVAVAIGIGLDSTTSSSAKGGTVTVENITGQLNADLGCEYFGSPVAGYHYLSWNEYGAGAGTQTWFGNSINATASVGLQGSVRG